MLSLAAYANPRPNPHHNPTATLPLKPHCESQTCLHLVPISVAASSQSCVNLAHTHTRSLPEKQSAGSSASFIPRLWRLRPCYHDNNASYGLLSCSFSSLPKMHLCEVTLCVWTSLGLHRLSFLSVWRHPHRRSHRWDQEDTGYSINPRLGFSEPNTPRRYTGSFL